MPDTPIESAPKEPKLVVAIGASAGGVAALKHLFGILPADESLSYVVITHQSPTAVSTLPDILKRETELSVEQCQDGANLAPNTAYVLQPGYVATIENQRMRLREVEEGRHPDSPIDTFFRAIAREYGDRAVGIVLSGSGTDGTLGVQEIKAQLGMTIASLSDEAEFADMPMSAANSGHIDHEAALDDMPDLLRRYRDGVSRQQETAGEPSSRDKEHAGRILSIVRNHSGHDFSEYKISTVLRRIRRRMNIRQFADLREYESYVRETKSEVDALYRDLLIGVTAFFRDLDAFAALEEVVFPELFPDGEREIRIWVPGCSTGEEAYSIAMMVYDRIKEEESGRSATIFATDVAEDSINIARRGVYPAAAAADMGSQRRERHFEVNGGVIEVKKHIRQMLIFSVQNLAADPPFTRLDLVSCRNVLIYLTTELQQKLIPLFHYSLRDGGVLFLGTSESTGSNDELFSPIDTRNKLFRKRPVAQKPEIGMKFPFSFAGETARGGKKQSSSKREVQRGMREYILDHHSPPAVFVNRSFDIVYVHGRTGRYLEPAAGEARMNLVDMAREGLAVTISTGLREALRTGSRVSREAVHLPSETGYVRVDIEIDPLVGDDNREDLCVVVFRERPIPSQSDNSTDSDEPQPGDQYVQNLEEELQSARERLQSTVEELETTNEELKSALEEAQSTNEELQSSNEELESSKEEMQSLNEELRTVNSELQESNEDLSKANSEKQNFLDNLDIPIIFVDNELRIRQFTEAAQELVNLIHSDITRQIDQLTTKFEYDGFIDDINQVVRRARHIDRVLNGRNGKLYQMRLSPYRDLDNKLSGVLISFLDIPEETEPAD